MSIESSHPPVPEDWHNLEVRHLLVPTERMRPGLRISIWQGPRPLAVYGAYAITPDELVNTCKVYAAELLGTHTFDVEALASTKIKVEIQENLLVFVFSKSHNQYIYADSESRFEELRNS